MDGAKNNERDSLSVNTVTNRDTKKILVGTYMGVEHTWEVHRLKIEIKRYKS